MLPGLSSQPSAPSTIPLAPQAPAACFSTSADYSLSLSQDTAALQLQDTGDFAVLSLHPVQVVLALVLTEAPHQRPHSFLPSRTDHLNNPSHVQPCPAAASLRQLHLY